MAEVNFEDHNSTDQTTRRKTGGGGNASGLTGFIQDKFGISQAGARKVMIGIAVVAFLVSLYFWFTLLT